MRTPVLSTLAAAALAVAWAAPVQAHPEAASGAASLTAGVMHPLLGMDHLIALLAAGLWAGRRAGAAGWPVAALFLAGLVAGSTAAFAGLSVPLVEAGIAVSVLVLGLLLAARAGTGASWALPALALFALLHGHAHAAALPLMASPLLYAAGFLALSAALLGVGLALGARLARAPALRVAGMGAAGAGLWLLAGV